MDAPVPSDTVIGTPSAGAEAVVGDDNYGVLKFFEKIMNRIGRRNGCSGAK